MKTNSANQNWKRPLKRTGIVAPSVMIFLSSFLTPLGADNSAKSEDAWVSPARAARKENPFPADAASIALGKELFVAACLPCHGPAGKGDGPAATTLERNGTPVKPGNLTDPKLREQTDGALFWKIGEGRTPMPAFQETFTEEQRWKIVNYVRTLAPKADNKNP
ncbi:MAG: cytochrome c [Verrucomicrobia bacterium]|nr:cytochrome c [Verrucomicrobiota bacterium]